MFITFKKLSDDDDLILRNDEDDDEDDGIIHGDLQPHFQKASKDTLSEQV